MTIAPEHYRYVTPMTIRYNDMDTLGHVNNAVYLTYFEQARVNYFRDLTLWTGEASEFGLILAKATCEYKLPLRMDDGTVNIWTRCSRIGNKSFEMAHLITRADESIAATGHTVMVAFDYVHNQTVAIPSAWRQSLIDYEPGLL